MLKKKLPQFYRVDNFYKKLDDKVVQFDKNGVPWSLIGGGHHFRDLDQRRRPVFESNQKLPKYYVMDKIVGGNFRRPPLKI